MNQHNLHQHQMMREKRRQITKTSRCKSTFNQRNASQMFRASTTIATITIIAVISSTLKSDYRADARLIRIYHKYRPRSADEPLNISSSTTLEQLVAGQDERAASGGKGAEYSSPMKRIMELIGQHSPVIVVSSSSGASNEQPNQMQTANSASNQIQSSSDNSLMEQAKLAALLQSTLPTPIQQSASQQPQVSASSTSAEQQQHWTLLDPNQMMQPPQMLSAQQQQLYQTTTPYEQYFINPNQFGDPTNQLAMMPNSLGMNPASPYQQMQYSNNPVERQLQQVIQQQQQQQQVGAQQQNLVEDRVQPIFLSSYVPEVPVGSTGLQPVQRLNSIQQIQLSQKVDNKPAEAEKAAKSVTTSNKQDSAANDSPSSQDNDAADENDSDSPAKSNAIDEPDDGSINGGEDIEEVNKTKRSQPGNSAANKQSRQTDPDDPDEPGNGGGSMSYEDKYDSDKEEPRSNNNKNYYAEPSSVVPGLVKVGLNDDCLQCICRASSGCDHLLRCITRGSDEKFCGPFQITEEYWNKAGSPNEASNNFQSFEDCANDADCAVESVTNYMRKYGKDCDGDSVITCVDYARLHRLRPDECDNTDKLANDFDAYWAKFQRCAEGYNRTRNGDDEDI